MYGPPGHAYVYFVYGMHHCVNVVCQPRDVPEAVLVRALEPLEGEALMRRRRGLGGAPGWRLCRGPGALCQAMGITRAANGADLVRGPLRIVDAPPVPAARVSRTTRIGVDYAGADTARPWRFAVTDSGAVSGRRLTSPRRTPRLARGEGHALRAADDLRRIEQRQGRPRARPS
jgi:DNA-3-methyladenine glycosylase